MRATNDSSARASECQAEKRNAVCRLADSAEKLISLADILEELDLVPAPFETLEVRRILETVQADVTRALLTASKAVQLRDGVD